LLSIGPNTDVIPTLEKSSSAMTPLESPPITATPASVRSTISAVIACSAKAALTTRRLILRRAEDSAKAMARMASTPARLSKVDVILSFTAADCPSVACGVVTPVARRPPARHTTPPAWQFAKVVASSMRRHRAQACAKVPVTGHAEPLFICPRAG